jgi:hypothetical protein
MVSRPWPRCRGSACRLGSFACLHGALIGSNNPCSKAYACLLSRVRDSALVSRSVYGKSLNDPFLVYALEVHAVPFPVDLGRDEHANLPPEVIDLLISKTIKRHFIQGLLVVRLHAVGAHVVTPLVLEAVTSRDQHLLPVQADGPSAVAGADIRERSSQHGKHKCEEPSQALNKDLSIGVL